MDLTRREFLKFTLAAGVAAKLAGCITGETEPAHNPEIGGLPRRILGRTEQPVTILGLGCGYVGAKGIDEAQTRATIEAALAGGVRYFDTCPDYVRSEERLGPILAPVRDEIFLVTKVNYPDAKGAEKDFIQSLKLLKTDHVDLLLQHCVGVANRSDTATMLAKGGSLEFMRKAKAMGLTRFLGMSIHHPHAAALTLLDAADDYDVVMPFVNYVSRAEFNAEGKVVERARRDGLGVTAMKVLGGDGQLADDYNRTFRYTLSVPGVSCALVGVRSADEVRRAVRAAKEFRPLTAAEMAETIRLGEQMFRSKSPKAALLERHLERDLAGAWYA